MKMKIYVPAKDRINAILNTIPESEEECFGEDSTIDYEAVFPDGYRMAVMVCGVQYEEGGLNLPYTQAVLFNPDGGECGCTEPGEEFFGEWKIGNYEVEVI